MLLSSHHESVIDSLVCHHQKLKSVYQVFASYQKHFKEQIEPKIANTQKNFFKSNLIFLWKHNKQYTKFTITLLLIISNIATTYISTGSDNYTQYWHIFFKKKYVVLNWKISQKLQCPFCRNQNFRFTKKIFL